MEVTIDFYRDLVSRLKTGEQVALATVVTAKGSTPREPGSKMGITADGAIIGTVGGGFAENETVKAASEVIQSGVPKLLHVELTGDETVRSGAICGGTMDIFIEMLTP